MRGGCLNASLYAPKSTFLNMRNIIKKPHGIFRTGLKLGFAAFLAVRAFGGLDVAKAQDRSDTLQVRIQAFDRPVMVNISDTVNRAIFGVFMSGPFYLDKYAFAGINEKMQSEEIIISHPFAYAKLKDGSYGMTLSDIYHERSLCFAGENDSLSIDTYLLTAVRRGGDKQYKGADGDTKDMANGKVFLPMQEQGGDDSLKVVPTKLTPEEKMKAKLDSNKKKLKEIGDEEYARNQMRPRDRPEKNYKKALEDMMFISYEDELYEAALKKDTKAVESAKKEIMEWGQQTGNLAMARKILEEFELNSK